MPRVTPVSAKKRKLEEPIRGRTTNPRKRVRKQKRYHSSSEESESEEAGFAPVSLEDSDDNAALPQKSVIARRKRVKGSASDAPAPIPPSAAPEIVKEGRVKPQEKIPASKVEEDVQNQAEDDIEEDAGSSVAGSEDEDIEESDDAEEDSSRASNSDAETGTTKTTLRPKTKRNDPEAFSTSISKILSTKLPSTVRSDPLLSRSKEAATQATANTDAKLDRKAQARLRAERHAAQSKGRITDVLGIERGIAGEVAEEEKALRKIAQRGVIQLFNAFQAAHVRAEEARREERRKGTIGMDRRDEKANADSKEAFLQMIGGKPKAEMTS